MPRAGAAPRVGVFGAGAWGTAVAVHVARRHPVMLCARDVQAAERLATDRSNARYLPDVVFPAALEVPRDLDAMLDWLLAAPESVIILGTTVAGLRPSLSLIGERLGTARPGGLLLVWLCKGLERDTGMLPHQVVAQVLPECPGAVLSGPSFAREVALGLPVALTVADRPDGAVAPAVVAALHHGAVRIYRSQDIVGVEVGGALKNVIAIAAGICDGLALGDNARAALITRGLAEIARFGAALGARTETFMGLTGLGDLVLTCAGNQSRNRRVGLALAAGQPLARVLAELGHVAEGVPCTEALVVQAGALGIEVPIASAVRSVLRGELSPREAVLSLLAREPRHE